MKLDDYDKKIVKEVQKLTLTDFGIDENNVTKDNFIAMLEEMISLAVVLQEKIDLDDYFEPNYEDIERDREYENN